MASNLMTRIANGAIWMLLFKFADRGLALISTLILVRLLSPSDFGIVGMAMAVIAIVELFTAFGFDTAIIRQKNANTGHYNTAWTFDVIFGGAVTAIMFIAAPYVADFYDEPEVATVIYILALMPLIGGLKNVGIVAFRKELDFKKEFNFQVAKKFFGFAVTIPLAFWLRNYWALVIGAVSARIFASIISYYMHPFRPWFSLVEAKSLMGFSKWLLAGNLTNYIKERASTLVIGRYSGAADVGIYNVSYEIANIPTTELGAPINRALMPGFAKLQDDPEQLRTLYSASMAILALIAVPAAAGIFAVAHFMVPVMLGPQWSEAVPLIAILALNGAVLMLQASIWSLLVGADLPRYAFFANAVYAFILLILLIILTMNFGLVGAAYACLITSVVSSPVYLAFLRKGLGLPAILFFKALMRPVIAAVAMVFAVRWILPAAADAGVSTSNLFWLATGSACGAVVYIALVTLMWLAAGRPDGAEQIVLDRATKEFNQRFKKAPPVQSEEDGA